MADIPMTGNMRSYLEQSSSVQKILKKKKQILSKISHSVLQRQVRSYGEIREYLKTEVAPNLHKEPLKDRVLWIVQVASIIFNLFFIIYNFVRLERNVEENLNLSKFLVGGFEVVGIVTLFSISVFAYFGKQYGTSIDAFYFCGTFSAFKLMHRMRLSVLIANLLTILLDDNATLMADKENCEKEIAKIRNTKRGNPIYLIALEQDLEFINQELKDGEQTLFQKIVAIAISLFVTSVLIWIPGLALLIKIQQLNFVVTKRVSWWGPVEYVTFFGFFNQLANIADVERIQMTTIYRFLFAKEDANFDDEERTRQAMVDDMIKSIFCRQSGWWGILQAANLNSTTLQKFFLKPPEANDWVNFADYAPEPVKWITIDKQSLSDPDFLLLKWSQARSASSYIVEWAKHSPNDTHRGASVHGRTMSDAELAKKTQWNTLFFDVQACKREKSTVSQALWTQQFRLRGRPHILSFRVRATNSRGDALPSEAVSVFYPWNKRNNMISVMNLSHMLPQAEPETKEDDVDLVSADPDEMIGTYAKVTDDDCESECLVLKGWATLDGTYADLNRMMIRWSPVYCFHYNDDERCSFASIHRKRFARQAYKKIRDSEDEDDEHVDALKPKKIGGDGLDDRGTSDPHLMIQVSTSQWYDSDVESDDDRGSDFGSEYERWRALDRAKSRETSPRVTMTGLTGMSRKLKDTVKTEDSFSDTSQSQSKIREDQMIFSHIEREIKDANNPENYKIGLFARGRGLCGPLINISRFSRDTRSLLMGCDVSQHELFNGKRRDVFQLWSLVNNSDHSLDGWHDENTTPYLRIIRYNNENRPIAYFDVYVKDEVQRITRVIDAMKSQDVLVEKASRHPKAQVGDFVVVKNSYHIFQKQQKRLSKMSLGSQFLHKTIFGDSDDSSSDEDTEEDREKKRRKRKIRRLARVVRASVVADERAQMVQDKLSRDRKASGYARENDNMVGADKEVENSWVYDLLFANGERAEHVGDAHIVMGFYNHFLKANKLFDTRLWRSYIPVLAGIFITTGTTLVYTVFVKSRPENYVPAVCDIFWKPLSWVTLVLEIIVTIALSARMIYSGNIRHDWLMKDQYPDFNTRQYLKCCICGTRSLVFLWMAYNIFLFVIFVVDPRETHCFTKLLTAIRPTLFILIFAQIVFGGMAWIFYFWSTIVEWWDKITLCCCGCSGSLSLGGINDNMSPRGSHIPRPSIKASPSGGSPYVEQVTDRSWDFAAGVMRNAVGQIFVFQDEGKSFDPEKHSKCLYFCCLKCPCGKLFADPVEKLNWI